MRARYAAVGVLGDAYERVELMREYVDAFVIDTAHGDSRNVLDTVRELKRTYGVEVVAGNVSFTDEGLPLGVGNYFAMGYYRQSGLSRTGMLSTAAR